MIFPNEEAVTKLLASKEIIKTNNENFLMPNPAYDLGDFLDKVKNTPSPYEGKYVFIR